MAQKKAADNKGHWSLECHGRKCPTMCAEKTVKNLHQQDLCKQTTALSIARRNCLLKETKHQRIHCLVNLPSLSLALEARLRDQPGVPNSELAVLRYFLWPALDTLLRLPNIKINKYIFYDANAIFLLFLFPFTRFLIIIRTWPDRPGSSFMDIRQIPISWHWATAQLTLKQRLAHIQTIWTSRL